MKDVRHSLAALAAACLLAACGGGGDTMPVTLVAGTAAAPTHVRIEGCVLDMTDRPLAVLVHATGDDGRLLASAMTDNDGVFRMHVPARNVVRLVTVTPGATPGAETLTLMTGGTDLTVGGCLRPALA